MPSTSLKPIILKLSVAVVAPAEATDISPAEIPFAFSEPNPVPSAFEWINAVALVVAANFAFSQITPKTKVNLYREEVPVEEENGSRS